VIFIPDISDMLPTIDQFLPEWNRRQQQKKEKEETDVSVPQEEVHLDAETQDSKAIITTQELSSPQESIQIEKPKEIEVKSETDKPPSPGVFITATKIECMMISLDGLLDYNENDKNEHTFEVSLFAELFHNMLQRDFGNLIMKALQEVPEPQKNEKKRTIEATESTQSKKDKRRCKQGIGNKDLQ